MSKNLRFFVALYVAKIMIKLMKILGRNASYLPGYAAVKICPDMLGRLELPKHILAVTGTNGKTTVSNMLGDIYRKKGLVFTQNSLGSNTKEGVVAAFIADANLKGTVNKDYAIIEVDERSSLLIYPYMTPEYMIVTNLFQDSYQRNAHPGYIQYILEKSIPDKTKLVLNADDLLVSGLKPSNPRVYFSLQQQKREPKLSESKVSFVTLCPSCHHPLTRDFVRYHHVGRFHCESCGFVSPEAQYRVTSIDGEKEEVKMEFPTGEKIFPLPGHNITDTYNMLSAAAYLQVSGLASSDPGDDFEGLTVVKSRFDPEKVKDKDLYIVLAKGKNPVAASRIMDYIGKEPGRHCVILVNGTTAKLASTSKDSYENRLSENTAWLYEADFEHLAGDNVTQIVVGGKRYLDFYVRLLMAGVDREKITIMRDPTLCYQAVDLDKMDDCYILFQVYNRGFAVANRNGLKERILHEN